MYISENLKKIMEERKLNLIQIAKICKVSVYKIKKWVSGSGLPRANDLYKICKGLNISAEWLVRNKLTK